MTIQQFLKRLTERTARNRRSWRVGGGYLREESNPPICPIAAVYEYLCLGDPTNIKEKERNPSLREVAQLLGLSERDMWAIISASDYPSMRLNKPGRRLREQLMRAVGL